ncbi:MAG: hypothetical protein A3F43_04345 [Gammaproteobacteria bacterium RIFCSPHIGHO2_12_FULL_42_10]|nr:MAG: hypothetical protein A3F43_04345 [Gammaproteobacteria bacterium RIFCSPHIGHO2_12_FULL_42_10]
MNSAQQPLKDAQLHEIINRFLDVICQQQPALKPIIQAKKDEIIPLMKAVLRPQQISPSMMQTPAFVKQLTVVLTVTLQVKLQLDCAGMSPEKNKALQAEMGMLLTALKETSLFKQDPKMVDQLMQALILDPNKLTLLLKPDQLKRIHDVMIEQSAALLTMKPSSGENKNALEALRDTPQKKDDPYHNLLGLMTSSQTGSIAIVIQYFVGNGLGMTDFNPNNGSAPIDTTNKVESVFGDSLGLKAATSKNFDSILGTVTSTLEACLGVNMQSTASAFQDASAAYLNRPQLSPPK